MRAPKTVFVAVTLLLSAGDAVVCAAIPPPISAPSAILVDARDGRVLYKRLSRERREIASTTKLMTALVSLQELPLDRLVAAIPYHPTAAESVINLHPGERMRTSDLLRALLLESANDAAVALAHAAEGSQRAFVRHMNERAHALRLTDTHYENPIGLDDPANYSTALDLSKLARGLLANRFLARTVDMPSAQLTSGAFPRTVDNRNDLIRKVSWIDGVKTGHTARAGYVLVGSGTRKGLRLVSAVLGAPSESARDADTLALLHYGFSLYKWVRVLPAGQTVATAKVAFYGDRRVRLVPARGYAIAVRRNEDVRKLVHGPRELRGPIAAGARVGTIAVLRDGRRVATVPLVTAERVPGAGIPRKLFRFLLKPWVLLAVAAAALLGAERRRRRIATAEAARRRRRRAARLE